MWVWLVLSWAIFGGYLPQGQAHLGVGGGGMLALGNQGKQGLRNIIYCSFLKHGDTNKPPILSHVRVSRGPEDREDYPNSGHLEHSESDPDSDQVTRSIKSPSYQHKQLGRLSQFHGSQGPYSSDVTYSLRPYSSAIYPVASVQAKGGSGSGNSGWGPGTLFIPHMSDNEDQDEGWQADGGGQGDNLGGQEPTYTPYIGSRILSNIPKFFEHLQENIKAIHDSGEGPSGESSGSISVESPFSGETQMDMPSRRGDYFQSDGRLLVDTQGYRYSPQDLTKGQNGDYASDEMLLFMGRDPKYKKANNYNPSWLFTNLGLGKRAAGGRHRFHHRTQ